MYVCTVQEGTLGIQFQIALHFLLSTDWQRQQSFILRTYSLYYCVLHTPGLIFAGSTIFCNCKKITQEYTVYCMVWHNWGRGGDTAAQQADKLHPPKNILGAKDRF